MKKLARMLAAGLGFGLVALVLAPLSAKAATWLPIKGNVRLANGTPVCAMVLANGQYMFSCDGTGAFNLNVPLDDRGQITLFAFADGFAPYRVTAAPAGLPSVVRTVTAAPRSPLISTTREVACAANNWVRISGEAESFGGAPLCAMVLANGQHMFSCGASQGRYDLTVPADENGHITLFAFADGFQPYSETFIAPECDSRFAVIDGIEITYRLEEVEWFGRNCGVHVDAVNTTAKTKIVTLLFDSFGGPTEFLEATYVSFYLPPYARDSNDPGSSSEGLFAKSLEKKVGCDYIYRWQLNSDKVIVR